MVEGLITRPSPTIEKKPKQNDNISEGKQKYLMGDFFFTVIYTSHKKDINNQETFGQGIHKCCFQRQINL